MMRRAVLLLAALLAVAAFAATPANAQTTDDYDALCSALAVKPANPAAGTKVTVSGTAASANADIAILLLGNPDQFLNSGTTGADRKFSIEVTIPAGASGTIKLQAVQFGEHADDGCGSQVASIDIAKPATPTATPPATEPLARTGTNSTMPLVRLGFGLLAAGGMAIFVSRRRKHSVRAHASA
jgi:hypothetical protein